ncbi:ethylene-insensitive protein 2-like isoform X1 [Cucurbita moschata]|uniref:Ethylene-insensitive protein 2-like isoform X1 n=1 Tax=Cucurbita moschata TaxID=3662 RepID=A0A6J1EDC6_CUCMO|nr:ethylene-insensitive protein 2-like isoform X1 [Cucurbita moschata]XP_022925855.1 ethylene-insensitive protein 2-like isoform X1 [Cucurbita moschata]XP_022925856.1 ethylene-insensitive protein 2-like isoform X1 [Cucurbita moschata]XP_022925857.1 ethylene-insensitive protein 2-like isoform X1 [Cucurbita moschata]
MESTSLHTTHGSGTIPRFIPFIAPALLVSISYVDPGKWAATVEGGARFGFDLFVLVLLLNLAAILCQYLSASIGVVTGRGLAQICSEEYDKCTCIFLGIQAEASVILLDLTMILGISHGLNLLLGWDLFTCVLLTGVASALCPPFADLLEDSKAKFLYICMAGFILISLVLGVLISQPEIPLSMNLTLTRLNGESAFTLMSLLGASVMPHNFYVHSSIVLQHQSPPNVSKEVLCHNHLFAIFCIFSGIYVVNNVLMNSAANVFYSSGLALHTFPDALSLMEQVFRSPVVYVLFLLVLFISNQITALTWSLGGQLVLTNFLKLDIPGWLHCATIRIIAIIPALCCVWSSGAEGMYQLLIFSQVMVALLLPSSVIPLYRIASSRPIMGAFKTSQLVEFIAIAIFIGILGLKIIFVIEMIFGNSDWALNMRWSMGSGMSIPYVILLITACSSFCLMLWLAATPLKSATTIAQLDTQVLKWDIPQVIPDSAAEREDIDLGKSSYSAEPVESHSDLSAAKFDFGLPENIMEPDQMLGSVNQSENRSISVAQSSLKYVPDELESTEEIVSSLAVTHDVPDQTLADKKVLKIDSVEPIEKTVGLDGDLRSEKDDYEVDNWEAEESLKEISGSIPSSTSEGPGSFRSIGGKSEEGGGTGTGSLSRLAGLGRAARRQLTAILDEFWGQLYDFHGVATQNAKVKKLDLLLGIDSKLVTSSLKLDAVGKDFPFSSPLGSKASDPIPSGLYDSPKSHRVQSSLESSYGIQKGHQPLWSNHIQHLDAYMNQSSHNGFDSGVKRYSSLRSLPSSESWDYQPATVHGYQFNYLSRMAKDKISGNLNGQLDSSGSKYHTLGGAGGASLRDSVAFAMGQKLQNGLGACQAPSPGFSNFAVSRNPASESERQYYDLSPSGTGENLSSVSNTKKYHSLPDIHRDQHVSDKSSQWDNMTGYGSSIGRITSRGVSYTNSGSRSVAPLAFDELSPSNVYRGALSPQMNPPLDSGSFWSRQPSEQFGMDKNSNSESRGIGKLLHSISHEASFVVNSEARLLQSFRDCIVRLLKLEGSEWLFGQSDGADEELIDCVAAREKFLYDAEAGEMNRGVRMKESPSFSPDRRSVSGMKNGTNSTNVSISSVSHCGEGCIWRSDLIVSFGVWCIHRILDLSLMESRPELWGKYTYVLNRLQGIIDPAFSKPRIPMPPCFCLQIPQAFQQRSSPQIANGMLPPAAKPGKGKCTTAAMLLDMVKDVEIAISCRKGRTGTAVGDVAFPKGKENLASVLKRYKRRLTNKPVATHEVSSISRKLPATSVPYSS